MEGRFGRCRGCGRVLVFCGSCASVGACCGACATERRLEAYRRANRSYARTSKGQVSNQLRQARWRAQNRGQSAARNGHDSDGRAARSDIALAVELRHGAGARHGDVDSCTLSSTLESWSRRRRGDALRELWPRALWACSPERMDATTTRASSAHTSDSGRRCAMSAGRAKGGAREELASPGDGGGERGDPPSASCREWPVGTIGTTRPASRHRRACARPRRTADREAHDARPSGRPVHSLHRGDAREVPPAPRESAVDDDPGARLHRLEERIPRHRQSSASAATRRGVPASGRAARPGGAGGLGALRQAHGGARGPRTLGLRDGARLQPANGSCTSRCAPRCRAFCAGTSSRFASSAPLRG